MRVGVGRGGVKFGKGVKKGNRLSCAESSQGDYAIVTANEGRPAPDCERPGHGLEPVIASAVLKPMLGFCCTASAA